MKADEAFNALQRQELMHKFVEIGKVLLTWAILKNVDMVCLSHICTTDLQGVYSCVFNK